MNWPQSTDAFTFFSRLFMDEPVFPKFNVAQQWVDTTGVLSVQLVEIATHPLQILLVGHYGIRVGIKDATQETGVAFTVSPNTASELRDLIGHAITAARNVTGNES